MCEAQKLCLNQHEDRSARWSLRLSAVTTIIGVGAFIWGMMVFFDQRSEELRRPFLNFQLSEYGKFSENVAKLAFADTNDVKIYGDLKRVVQAQAYGSIKMVSDWPPIRPARRDCGGDRKSQRELPMWKM